jgi:hypothetical protein
VKTLLLLMIGVGHLMSPSALIGSPPPVATFKITTETPDPLITEAGDNLVTEDAP